MMKASESVARISERAPTVQEAEPPVMVEEPAGEELAAFRAPTAYCDSDHPAVQALAAELARGAETDRAFAIRAFAWVRDEVRYQMAVWNQRASQVIDERRGSCSSKANLYIALLRARGIAAGFRVMTVEGGAYFGVVAVPMFRALERKTGFHIYAGVHLGGRWVRADPSDDKALSDGIEHINPQARYLEFDGKTDAMLGLLPEHIQADYGYFANPDFYLGKVRERPFEVVRTLELYLDFLREHGRRYQLHDGLRDELQRDFRQWMGAREPETLRAFDEYGVALQAKRRARGE